MSEVSIIALGPIGSGKSALLGEIAIALQAIGVPVRFENERSAEQEQNMTHADWASELDRIKPSVVLVEKIQRAEAGTPEPPQPQREVTEAMMDAGLIAYAADDDRSAGTIVRQIWRAMEAARVPMASPNGWQAIMPEQEIPGRHVLLWWPHWVAHRAVTGWWDGRWHSPDVDDIAPDSVVAAGPGPTQWQPLPAPPTEAGTPELNRPCRTREAVALERATAALKRICARPYSLSSDTIAEAERALADIAALVRLYDPRCRCRELADIFLADQPGATVADARNLAQHIQQSIESWLAALEVRAAMKQRDGK